VLTLSLVLFLSSQLLAQIDTGRILGTVQDQSHAVIPGAKVRLINEGTGFVLTTTTGSTGGYLFEDVKIGTYTVEAEFQGFQKISRVHVPLHVQEEAVVDFTLTPGQVTQSIEVTGAAPVLQTQDASLGQVVSTTQVNDLPLNGRNWTQLGLLVAGVSVAQGQSPVGGEPQYLANGAPATQNDYRLNGIDNNNEIYAAPYLYTALPPPDAIAEFKLQTSNYSAEFGHGAGGVMNAAMKAGGNRLHGDVWEYVRNDDFDTANFFENAANEPKGAFRQNQFGFTLGGPITIPHVYSGKDKTFFFIDYQGTRVRQASPFVDTVPTAAMRNSGYTDLQDLVTFQSGSRTDNLGRTTPLGTVFDPATTRTVTAGQTDPVTGLVATTTGLVRDPFYQGSLTGVTNFMTPAAEGLLNMLPAGRLDPNAVNLLNIYPVPSAGAFYNNFTYDPGISDDIDLFDIRIDHNFSAKDQLFGVYDSQGESQFVPGPLPGIAQGNDFSDGPHWYGGQELAVSETHSFSSTLINEFRFGYNRTHENLYGTNGNTLGIPEQFGIQGIPQVAGNGGLPNINLEGLSSLGTAGWLPTLQVAEVYEVTDNLTKVYGKQTFKGGIQIDSMRAPILQPAWSHGGFSFDGDYTEVPYTGGGSTGLAQLLLTPTASTVPNGFDNVGGVDSMFASNFHPTDDSRNYYGAYFQDDWKVTRKLTVNLGMRWDYFEPYAERYGAQANLIPGAPFNGATFLLASRQCSAAMGILSPSFTALTALDGIDVKCGNNALGHAQRDNWAPRVGFAYQFTPKLVARGGYGIFYGALGNTGYGNNIGNNYPFLFDLDYFAPDDAHPITYPSGKIATLETGFTGISLSPASVDAEGLALNARQYNYLTPYVQSYNFTFQYQLSPNQSVQLGYVGSGGRHLDIFNVANAPSEILPPGVNPQTYVPFPDFARNTAYESTEANTYYNSVQANLERHFSGGLIFLANYTYSKCRSDYRGAETNTVGGYRAPRLPGFGIQGDYNVCDGDVPQIFHISGTYQLPFGAGKRLLGQSRGALNQVVGGWSANWILTEQDGQPFGIGCPIGTTSDFGCNALLVPGQNMYAGPHNENQWLNPAAFANPAVATAIGQTSVAPLGGSYLQAHGPGIHRMDFSLFKQFPIKEATRLEFRCEVFNLTNTPMFGQPGQLDFTNPVAFSQITSTRDGGYDPREIQFALKLYW
jgi:hypothetical protein